MLTAIAGYSAVAAIAAPFTWPARAATAVPILVLLGLAVRRGWHRRGLPARAVPAEREVPAAPAAPAGARSGRHVGAVVVWVVILGAAVTVQLLNFWADPREIYPTLSSLLEDPLSVYPGRAMGYAVWLWLGWYLVER